MRTRQPVSDCEAPHARVALPADPIAAHNDQGDPVLKSRASRAVLSTDG